MSILLSKFKEVVYSVLPITVIVAILHFTIAPVPPVLLARFLIGTALIILGLTIFLFGVDIGITPLGNHIGASISKKGKLWLIIVIGLLLGFFVTVAEPDLQVLASQVQSVTSGLISNVSILIVVSLGIGVMLALGLLRIVYNIPLYKILMAAYGLIFFLAIFVSPEFFAISFDASGATTGSLTVPFTLALAMGISVMKKDAKASEKDSFGLMAISSCGAIIGVMAMGILSKVGHLTGTLDMDFEKSNSIFAPFLQDLPKMSFESAIALLPILIIFIGFQLKVFHFPLRQFRRILKGILYTLVGLILFLTGVNAGFMDVGKSVGHTLAQFSNKSIVIVVGFILGFVTIFAEPAVHVLTSQIELVTSGYVNKKVVLGALTIGVGGAVALSVVRILVPQVQLWHYLVPGYLICLIMSYFVPKLFVGIAFDSGGVASGSITATFIFAFAQGVAESTAHADVLRDAFGLIALVAMMPIITLQILGLLVMVKSRKRGDSFHV